METLRRKYEEFMRGEKTLAVIHEAMLALEEARRNGYGEIMDEIADMLIDLQFSLEDNKCRCHRKFPTL